jgi:mitochondrial import receptor subunit TOM40
MATTHAPSGDLPPVSSATDPAEYGKPADETRKDWPSWGFDIGLPNPGKFEDISKETKDITGTQEFFDGMRFELQRGLSSNFTVAHLISMGSSDTNGSYTFHTTYQTNKALALGRFDSEGRVIGRVQFTPTQRFTATVQSQVSLDPPQSHVSGELDYKGNDFYGQARVENKGGLSLSYLQSVTNNVSVGGELVHVPSQGTVLALGARLNQPKWILSGMVNTMSQGTLGFTWKTGKKADFATELAMSRNPQDDSLQSLWSGGFIYTFRTSRFKATVNSDLRVGACLDELLNDYMKVSLVGDLDHREQKYKLGFGLSFNM